MSTTTLESTFAGKPHECLTNMFEAMQVLVGMTAIEFDTVFETVTTSFAAWSTFLRHSKRPRKSTTLRGMNLVRARVQYARAIAPLRDSEPK